MLLANVERNKMKKRKEKNRKEKKRKSQEKVEENWAEMSWLEIWSPEGRVAGAVDKASAKRRCGIPSNSHPVQSGRYQ